MQPACTSWGTAQGATGRQAVQERPNGVSVRQRVYHATEIKTQAPVNHTDIYVPVPRVTPRAMRSKRREQGK